MKIKNLLLRGMLPFAGAGLLAIQPMESIAAPQLASSGSLDGKRIALCFSNALDPQSAADAGNFTVQGATVTAATVLADNKTILLDVEGLTGTSYNVSATGLLDAQGSEGPVSATGTVQGWIAEDIGTVGEPGRAYSCENGSIMVRAGGFDTWFNEDSFHYVYKEMTGDFDVRVRVQSVSVGHPSAKAALMLRENSSPGSRHSTITVYPGSGNWVAFQRVAEAGASSVVAGNWNVAFPSGTTYPNVWMRLRRVGQAITLYGSTNGEDWTRVGDTHTYESPLPDSVLIGLATTSLGDQFPGSPMLDVEYRDFGDYVINEAQITIAQQPAPVTVTQNGAVNFTVGVTVTGASPGDLVYQWQRNGEDIQGANSTSYSINNAGLADNGTIYRVKISIPGKTEVISEEVKLTVEPDIKGPEVASISSLGGSTIAIRFNEALEETAAGTIGNYSVQGAEISNVRLQDDRTVVLDITGLTGSNFTVSFSGIEDVFGNISTATASGTVLDLVSTDIGEVALPSVVYSHTTNSVTVHAAGLDIWFNADSFNFTHEERSGDFDVRVRVDEMVNGPGNGKAALMIRESLEPGSRHVTLTVYPASRNFVAFRRAETDGASTVLDGNWNVPWAANANYPNTWLRLRRSGQTITTFGSADGQEWVQVGAAYTSPTPFPANMHVGVATASTVNDPFSPQMRVTYSHYGDFVITGTINVLTQPSNLTVVENRPATFNIAATVENGSASALIYQWQRDGVDIEGATAASYTIPTATSGDNQARFRVRISLPGGSSILSDEVTLTVQEDNASPVIASTHSITAGNVGISFNELVTPESANNAQNYTLGGNATVESALLQPDGRTVVLQVNGLSQATYTITANNIADLEGNSGSSTATGVTEGMISANIGDIIQPAEVISSAPDQLTVRAAGADIWGPLDSFHYLYEPVTGDFDVRLQVTGVSLATGATRGGLMVRETADPDSRNIFAGTYPAGGDDRWVGTVRFTTGGATVLAPGNSYVPRGSSFSFPNAWMRIKRVDDTFTSYYSTNGVDWIQLGNAFTPDVAYPETVLLGVASASIVNSQEGVATFQYRNYEPTPSEGEVTLNIERSGANVVLNWPQSLSGFRVEEATRLAPNADWQPINEPVTGNSVTIPMSGTARFFRLAR